MGIITVKVLKEIVDEAVKAGKGDARVFISKDEEGNGFHGLFYGLTALDTDEGREYLLPLCTDGATENDVVLG
jgi:hypothetical protein